MGLFNRFKNSDNYIKYIETNYMISEKESIEALKKIDGWEIIANFSVGGFEWLGFSKEQPKKLILISSQKTTILNCDDGNLEECEIDYDEDSLIAYCNLLPNELISIAGQYGGSLPLISGKGEHIISNTKENVMKITFISAQGKESVIHWNYGVYICGFSYDGNYFVIAKDAGIIVMKRSKKF